MPLSPGTRLGPYEVVSPIGAGGMGEVFRARDTRLQRDVALKILPDLFANDPERLARFQREAQVLASLNDRNIAAIYGLEESEATKALVLELVEGPTLADRLAAGPLPIDDAIAIARQVADALETAHGQGIVHRDLKPANIKVRPDGTVKVLDFGLAKALDPARPQASIDTLDSPTITAGATQLGMILGTAAYMAPEQAKGKAVDKRADIWAFGCVLYEMLTGRRAFAAEDISDTLAFVITKEPDWSALPANVPAPLRRLLRRCLEKDRKRRLADIADARLELDEALTAAPVAPGSIASVPQQQPVWLRAVPWAVAAAAILALLAALAVWAPWRGAPASQPLRTSMHLGADVSLRVGGPGAGPALALSRQGDVLAFIARGAGTPISSLWVRRLDQLTATRLAGTEGASSPFFSPDGHWIAFFADGKLKKIATTGGIVSTLANAPMSRGGDWADDGTIVFTPDRAATPVLRVPADGGRAEPVTSLGREEATHRFPQVLAGGNALIYTAHSSTSGFDAAKIVVKPLPDGSPRVVVDGGYFGRYVASGHLIYIRSSALHAVPFDVGRLQVTGAPATIVESLTAGTRTAAAQIAVAGNGTAVYVTGGEADIPGPILWIDKQGATSPLRATPAVVLNVQFSPDGRQLAIDSYDGQQWDIWTYDWQRDKLSRLTDEPTLEQRPVWTVDGVRIAFASIGGDASNRIYSLNWQRADHSAPAQRLTQSENLQRPASWHPSGKFLAFTELNPQTSWDVWMLPMAGSEATGWKAGTPTPFLNHRSAETEPAFSPDGRFVAYQSDETGQDEIYVRPFPGPGGREVVSSSGGAFPQWSPHEPDLLYVANGRIMAARYSIIGGEFRADKPRPWTAAPFSPRSGPASRGFDLHPDGTRFAFVASAEDDTGAPRDHVVLILNLFDELRRLAPPKR